MKSLFVRTGTFVIPVLSVILVSCNHAAKNNPGCEAKIDSLDKQLTMMAEKQEQLANNKRLVADFYQELFGDKNIDAIDKYVDENYIQHNPTLPDGREALKKGAETWFVNAPKEKIDIQHIGADGNLVYLHTKAKRGNQTLSVIDIFRIDNGKIAEHWDVIQEVPKNSENPHPMF